MRDDEPVLDDLDDFQPRTTRVPVWAWALINIASLCLSYLSLGLAEVGLPDMMCLGISLLWLAAPALAAAFKDGRFRTYIVFVCSCWAWIFVALLIYLPSLGIAHGDGGMNEFSMSIVLAVCAAAFYPLIIGVLFFLASFLANIDKVVAGQGSS